MPNFPSIYLELQELWKKLRIVGGNVIDLDVKITAVENNITEIQGDIADGVAPSGPAGGILSGSYPNPNALTTLTGSLSGTLPVYFKTHTKFINGTNTQSDGGVIQFERQNPQENEDLFRVVIKGFDVTSSSDVLSGAMAGGITVHGGNGNNFAPGGAATLYGGYGKPVGGAAIVQAGYGPDSGGSVYITSGQGISSLGGDILIVAESGSVRSGGILLKTENSAIAGDISIQTGESVSGEGGDIRISSSIGGLGGDIYLNTNELLWIGSDQPDGGVYISTNVTMSGNIYAPNLEEVAEGIIDYKLLTVSGSENQFYYIDNERIKDTLGLTQFSGILSGNLPQAVALVGLDHDLLGSYINLVNPSIDFPNSPLTLVVSGTANTRTDFKIQGRDALSGTLDGGNVTIDAGISTRSGSGGSISLHAGNSGPYGTGSAGGLIIQSGDSVSGSGGAVYIESGRTVSTQPGKKGGDMYLRTGAGAPGTIGGNLYIQANNNGNIEVSASGDIYFKNLPSIADSARSIVMVDNTTGLISKETNLELSTDITLYTSSLIIANNGYGISFPSNGNGSNVINVSNTLNDYEQGRWTPALFGSGSDTDAITGSSGRYTKIGKQVTVHCWIENNNSSNNSIDFGLPLKITGLPFSASSAYSGERFPAFGSCQKIDDSDTWTDKALSGYVLGDTSEIRITTDMDGGHEHFIVWAQYYTS